LNKWWGCAVMRIFLTLASNLRRDIWYHGSSNKFERYDPTAKKLNRGSNPQGIYLTQDKNLATEFAGASGYVYTVVPKTRKTFWYKTTEINDQLIASYKKAILKHTNYKSDWIDDALIPQMLREIHFHTVFT